MLGIGRIPVDRIIAKLSSLDEHTVREASIGSFIYSAVFLIEGIGLCLRKRWAEFMTFGVTISLLPLELYELARHVTIAKVIVTVLNVAIAAYLWLQIRRRPTAPG